MTITEERADAAIQCGEAPLNSAKSLAFLSHPLKPAGADIVIPKTTTVKPQA